MYSSFKVTLFDVKKAVQFFLLFQLMDKIGNQNVKFIEGYGTPIFPSTWVLMLRNIFL